MIVFLNKIFNIIIFNNGKKEPIFSEAQSR